MTAVIGMLTKKIPLDKAQEITSRIRREFDASVVPFDVSSEEGLREAREAIAAAPNRTTVTIPSA